MDVSKLPIPELVAICEELGINVGQAKRSKPIMGLVRESEMSNVELREAWELIQKWERDERAKKEKQERDERVQAERQEREGKAKNEPERARRARELVQKRLELETLKSKSSVSEVNGSSAGNRLEIPSNEISSLVHVRG